MSTDIELYPRDQTDFSHHGYSLDDISNDIVTWQLNAKFTLTFDYPMFSEHAGDLVAENIVRVPVPRGKAAFRIAQVIKSMGHLSITAYHVFWDLNDDFIADTNIVDKDGQGALDQIMRAANYPTGFKVLSTIGNVTNARLVRMSIINALMGTDDNTFLNRWGGEFDWQDFSFSANPRLGKDCGVHFEYAHNLTGYEATKDSSGIITRLLPEGYNGLLLPELYVDSPKLGNYRKPKIGTKTYQDIKAIDETQATGDQEGAVPVQEAYELLRAAAAKEFSESHIDEAQWTYKLNVALLENTEEYKDLSITTTVLPGDTVTITHKLDGIDVRARLTGYTWQPSNHSYLTQTYDSTSRPDVAYSNLSSQVNEIKSQIELVDKVVIAKAANGMNSTGWGDQSPVDLNIAGKTGDVYYQTTANGTIMWLFHDGQWNAETGDAFGTEVQRKVDAAIADAAAAEQAANDAVAKANSSTQLASMSNQTAQAAKSAADSANALATQAVSAASDAKTALATANSALETATDQKTTVATLVTKTDDLAGTIATLATKTDINKLSGEVTAAQTLAQQTADGLQLKADQSVVNTINGSVNQLSADLKVANDRLSLTMTKNDVTGLLTPYATQSWTQGQITATAGEWSAKLSTMQSKYDGIGISQGRNYVQNSRFDDVSDSHWIRQLKGLYYAHDHSLVNKGKVGLHLYGTPTALYQGYVQTLPIKLAKGEQVTVGMLLSFDGDVSAGSVSVGLHYLGEDESILSQEWNIFSQTDASKNVYKRYSMQYTADTDVDHIRFMIYAPKAGNLINVYVTEVAVTVGPVSYGWAAAPEDSATYTDMKAAELKLTVDGLTTTMTDFKASTTVSLQTLKGFQNTTTDQLGGLQSQQTQLSDQITTIIESRDNIVRKAWFDDSKVGGWAGSIFTTDATITVTGHKNYLKLSARDNIENGNDFTVSSNEVYYIDAWVNTYNTKYPVSIGLQITMGDGSRAWVSAASMDTNHGPIHISGNVTIPGKGRSAIPWIQVSGTAGSDLGFALVLGVRITRNAGSSQITQLQDAINLRVSKGDVLSQINLEANRTLIQSGKLVLDAPTVVFTGNAFIPSAAIASLSADKITTGTLNAANLNVINLNASAIVTGTISGANLAINLNTGEVLFQKGSIKSTNGLLNINIDNGTFAQGDGVKGMLFTQGELYLSTSSMWASLMGGGDGAVPDYGKIGFNQAIVGQGLLIEGKHVLTLGIHKDNWPSTVIAAPPSLMMSDTGWFYLNGRGTLVQIDGGDEYEVNGFSSQTGIYVGTNMPTYNQGLKTRIVINAEYVHIRPVYEKTTSSSPNVFVASDGALVRSTSASKYKANIKRDRSTELAERLLTLPTAHWLDKAAMQRFAAGEQNERPQSNFGLIAEDLAAVGLEDLVVRGVDGELEGIQYDRIAAALLPLLAQMKNEIDELKATA